ncbi:MAG: ATP-dependent DNA ligase, partial [Saprospiraceae bacterium]|nr:ATP-dependent DNA ligase [Saprospiraceae bacterium]
MRKFAQLVENIDKTNSTKEKLNLLVQYFEDCDPRSALWAIALFANRRPKRPFKSSLMRQWAANASNLPLWLFEESYHIVGDLAETVATI